MLGSESKAKQTAARELISLIIKLGGKIAVFTHSRDELQNVLRSAANYLDNPDGRGTIVFESRKRGISRADLLLLAESLEDKLNDAGISVKATPRYIEEFQIDEIVFEQVLDDEVSYLNPRAREYDINSVRSIYVIRGNTSALSMEKAQAVFVTSNTGFAQAAWEYGQLYESSRNVSCVITDFSLANMAWLKAPMGANTIPTTQLLAFSYAALGPSTALLTKYMAEIDRLEQEGAITERDHQLLRSSPSVYAELMHLTLGDDSALTTETVTETLERVTSELKKEESGKLTVEQSAHQETQEALGSLEMRNREIISNLYWRCHSRAGLWAWMLSGIVGVLLAIALFAGLGLRPPDPIISWVLIGSFIVLALLTLANLVFGSTVKGLHSWLQSRFLAYFLKRESKALGVDLSEPMT